MMLAKGASGAMTLITEYDAVGNRSRWLRLEPATDGRAVVLVEVDEHGRVRFENEEWSVPNLQERRAILHSARNEIENLREVIEALDR